MKLTVLIFFEKVHTSRCWISRNTCLRSPFPNNHYIFPNHYIFNIYSYANKRARVRVCVCKNYEFFLF